MDHEVCGTYHTGVLGCGKFDYEAQIEAKEGGEFG